MALPRFRCMRSDLRTYFPNRNALAVLPGVVPITEDQLEAWLQRWNLPYYYPVAETPRNSIPSEAPAAAVRRSRPAQAPAPTQPAPITRNRSQPGRGQKRTNAGTTVDPADQQNPSTQASGSQRPQRHVIPTRRVMEATGNSTQQMQSGNSPHMEIDSDNEA